MVSTDYYYYKLKILKDAAAESNKIWKSVGKPRQGPIFLKRQSSRALYRKRIREKQTATTESYSNDLHEALLKKNGTAFWRCWRSNFGSKSKCSQVEGCIDPDVIADKFADHFKASISCNDPNRAESLKKSYLESFITYCGSPITDAHKFDTELVSHVIMGLKQGKASDIDGLSAEHLQYCHPILSVILAKLFNLMMSCTFVPDGFRYSYIVPIPKPKDCYSKYLTCDNFRGIAISPVLSKVFEHCLLDRYKSFLNTSDRQFGFKKGVGCNFAIRSVRNVVDLYVSQGSTANLCAIDVSKAFDRVNHFALLSKLMKRLVPVELLILLDE